MAVNKRLLQGAAAAPGGITPSEHFGVVLYEGDGSSSHSINGGKFGAAAYFNATNAKVSISQELDIGNINKSWTISYWAKTNATGFAPVIYARQTHNFNTQVKNDTVYYNFYNSAAQAISISHDVTDWTHVVLAHNGSTNTVTPYINGVAQTSKSTSGTQTQSQSDIIIGNNDGSGSANPKLLDQIRFFQKELSSSEVSTLYAETAATVESLDPLSEDTTDTLQVLGDSSCIATYKFENDETDLSGNYDGTGTSIQYAAGRYGQAASFNGSSSYINPNGDWGVNGDSSHSVSFWVNFNSSSGTQHFYGIGDTVTAFTHTSLYIDSSLGTVAHDNNGNSDNLATSLGLSTGQWYHFVLVYDTAPADAIITLYINSESKGTVTRTLNVTGDAVIGRRPYYSTNYLNADLDQFRVFNKALSASEVTTLYNENSLVASYRFEGNANDDMRAYDGSATNVSYEYGLNFTPDFVWLKLRSAAGYNHVVFDSTRGATKRIYPNETVAENSNGKLISFDTGGFTFNGSGSSNVNGQDFVAWCLKANGGTTSSNTDGTITSTVQANQDSGFSIVTYSGTGSTGTYGHGLSESPDLIITKRTSSAEGWLVWSSSLSASNYMYLQGTGAAGTDTNAYKTISATTNQIGTDVTVNTNGQTYVAYCFNSVDGFSKFGSYTGTGDADDRPIIETGFEPAFVMVKNTSFANTHWVMFDNKRNLTNPRTKHIKANSSNAEENNTSGFDLDFLSNGFQVGPTSSQSLNRSSDTYIYMAFAADPDTEAPTVAKSFTTVAYTGTGSSQSIDGLGFQPNFVWIKNRNTADRYHQLFDSIRMHNALASNTTGAQVAEASNGVRTYDANGFTVAGTGSYTNANGEDYVAWAWKADDNEPTIFGGSALAVYKFEDNANDVTGDYNGTASNVSYVTGKFNKAADFNGTNSKITFSTSFSQQTSFTVSFWMKSSQYNDDHTIFQFEGDSNVNSNRIGLASSGTKFGIFPNNTTSGAGFTAMSASDSSSLYDGSYHHVALVVDGTSNTSAKIYIDGVSKALTTGESYTTTMRMTGNMRIGTRKDDDSNGFYDGEIDQLRIYNGAVSDIGVAALYAETTSDNDDLTLGAPPKSIVSANANAGFSIVKYEGTGVTGTRVPHGLSSAPELWIGKQLTGSAINWQVLYSGFSEGDYLSLNLINSKANSANVTFDPTATTVKFHANQALNDSGEEYIGYAFHSVSGYSKIGTYSGNGTSQTVTLGFRPDFVMLRKYDDNQDWFILDSVRGDTQPFDARLKANASNAETTSDTNIYATDTGLNFSSASFNDSGKNFIYMAFKIN